MSVRRPFEVRQYNQFFAEDIIIRVYHENVEHISLEIDHPFYDESQSIVLDLETATQLAEVLITLLEEQKQKSSYVNPA